MLHFTKNESKVIVVLAFVILSASLATHVFKRYPFIQDIVNLIDSQAIYIKTDLNTAKASDLEEIPYIGVYTARRIIEYREQIGKYESKDQIRNISGIREENFKRFSPYLEVR